MRFYNVRSGIVVGLVLSGAILWFGSRAQTGPAETKPATPGKAETSAQEAVTFTNRSGGTYALDDLAVAISRLRSAVDGAAPVIAAFNQSASKETNSSNTIAGAVSGVLSDALGKTASGENAGRAEPKSNSRLTNLLGVLEGLLGTNNVAAGPEGLDAATLRRLRALEGTLQTLASTLDALDIGLPSEKKSSPGEADKRVSPTGRPAKPAAGEDESF